jgi:hypothetical protein
MAMDGQNISKLHYNQLSLKENLYYENVYWLVTIKHTEYMTNYSETLNVQI